MRARTRNTVMALFLVAIGVGLICSGAETWCLHRTLERDGIEATALVTGKQRSGKVNPFTIDYRFRDTRGLERDGRQNVGERLYDAVAPGTVINIRQSRADPGRNAADLARLQSHAGDKLFGGGFSLLLGSLLLWFLRRSSDENEPKAAHLQKL